MNHVFFCWFRRLIFSVCVCNCSDSNSFLSGSCAASKIECISINHTDSTAAKMILSPYDIKYTQRSISCYWRYGTETIDDTLDELFNGEICVDDIPPIRVVQYYGEYYSLDNRRLWVFKQFGEDIYCERCFGCSLPIGKGYYGHHIRVRRRYYNRGYGSYQSRSNASRSTRRMWNKYTNNRRNGSYKIY